VKHVGARASAVMTDYDNIDDTNDSNFTDILREIFGATFMASLVLDLDLAFGPVDSNVDFDRTPPPSLLTPLSPRLPPRLASPPSSTAAANPPAVMRNFCRRTLYSFQSLNSVLPY